MIPRNFIPKKKTAKITKKLLEEPVQEAVNPENLKELMRVYDTLLTSGVYYDTTEKIAAKMECSNADLQAFCDELADHEPYPESKSMGIYLSALVNKLLKKDNIDVVSLRIPPTYPKLEYVGINLRGGTFMIEGDIGDFAGIYMSGGCLIVEGSTGIAAGYEMNGGELHAEKIEKISSCYRGGKIYEGKKMVRG